MKQKSVGRLFLFLFLTLLIVSVVQSAYVSAADVIPAPGGFGEATPATPTPSGDSNFLGRLWDIWSAGGDKVSDTDKTFLSSSLRFMLLALVIILVYSSLSYGRPGDKHPGFPSNAALRLLIAIIVGFLATFYIGSSDIFEILKSYTALGITFSIFFPILILAFFTIVVSRQANPIGMFVQTIAWGIYSIYLLIKSLQVYITGIYYTIPTDATGKVLDGAVATYQDKLSSFWITLGPYLKPIFGVTFQEATQILKAANGVMSFVLLITAILVFSIMVMGREKIRELIQEEELEAEKNALKVKQEKASAYDDVRSRGLEKG